jgi:hypothetical protein
MLAIGKAIRRSETSGRLWRGGPTELARRQFRLATELRRVL